MTYQPHADDVTAAPHLADCDKAREQGLPCGCITRDVLAAVGPAIAARAVRQAADDLDTYRAETYPEDIFHRPTSEDYKAINALLLVERGHQLEPIAADCYDRAITVQAERLRNMADRIEQVSS